MAETFDLSHGGGDYEIKRYEVKDYKYFISVSLEVGLVGDEGTMASIFCRDRVHLFVGTRGGIKYSYRGRNGKQVTKPLADNSLLAVKIAQR